MFKKMIIASEISKGEFDIIQRIQGFKKFGTKECLLVQYLNPNEAKSTVSSFVTDILDDKLNKQKTLLTELGFAVETRRISDDMKHEINKIAEEENGSLIVAGASEHTMIGEMFFAGVAHDVIHKATKPVLLVRVSDQADHTLDKAKDYDIAEHILFPTDFSNNASTAFHYIKDMVKKGAKKVTLVHIQDKSKFEPHLLDQLEDFNKTDMKRLEHLKQELINTNDLEVNIELLYGSPASELLTLIKALNISLVIMGSQGRGFIREIYLGSLSHNIARHSSASVLLIPAERN
jgi:nucleotide-binding universal stress UspA family protein